MHSIARPARLLLALVALVAGIILPTAGPAGATPKPTVINDCAGTSYVKPRMINSIYCGDAGIIVSDISWSSWQAARAEGTGVEHRKTCVPNCADGPIAVQPVTVRLSKVKKGEFTTITLVNENGLTDTYPLTGVHRR
ncbi:hypothetical protein AAFP30_05645 [Gordonia sp. CPCC 205515]|uniref:hypothetical protein n=1 Tax=Gordonia sp. CPCC 205515 TaxID=3140791 RepID=UPI003AF361AC